MLKISMQSGMVIQHWSGLETKLDNNGMGLMFGGLMFGVPSIVRTRWRQKMTFEELPAWSWGDRWRAAALCRTPCCGPAVRDLHTDPHPNPAWFCIWQRLTLRCNSSGKLDYKIQDVRSTGEGFITSAFGVQTWFSSAQLVYIHWNPSASISPSRHDKSDRAEP